MTKKKKFNLADLMVFLYKCSPTLKECNWLNFMKKELICRTIFIPKFRMHTYKINTNH